jgi:hypothetical protein
VNNAWGITKTFFGLTGGRGGGPEELPIDHNTAIPGGYSADYVAVVHSPAMVHLRLTNNLIGFGSFGVSSPKGDSKWLPYATIARNALLSLADTGDGEGPSGTGHPTSIRHALSDAAAAGLNPERTLRPKSPNRNRRKGHRPRPRRTSASVYRSMSRQVRMQPAWSVFGRRLDLPERVLANSAAEMAGVVVAKLPP